jgi:UDP-GlcNAc:undecaprenyl-phosphate GlcNAc-1-phosphate transferase
MDKYLAYLPIIFFAFCISFALTPLIIFLARRFGAIDQPKTKRSEGDRTRERRIHRKPTPKLGGVPVFFSFVAVALLFLNPTTELLGFLGIVSVLFFMGIYDDIYEISAGKQFIFQIFAAVSASLFLKLPFVSLFGIDIDLNWLQYESGGLNISFPGDLLIFAWIILLINSIKWSAGADAVM